MKNRIFLLIIIFFSFHEIGFSNNGIVYVTKVENKKKVVVPMTLEITGDLNMFSMSLTQTELVQVSETKFREIEINTNKEYYLGNGQEVEVVTPTNLKKLAKKYFVDTPELLKRIGKRGFRYENLPSMVLYHNKLKKEGKPLTKKDIKHWTLIN